MTTLLLVRHARTGETSRALPTADGRQASGPGAELDGSGRAEAAALRAHLPACDVVWSSHARRAVQTAELALRAPDLLVDDLAELSFGDWAGQELAALHAADPDGVGAWLADARVAPPGGESQVGLRRRARRVLRQVAAVEGTVALVTHGGFVRAALGCVLGGGPADAWAVDVPPCSVAVLHRPAEGRWQVRVMGWQPALAVAASGVA